MNLPVTQVEQSQLVMRSANLPEIKAQVEEVGKALEGFAISDEASFTKAAEASTRLAKIGKVLSDDKESIYRPIKKALDAVNADFKPVIDMVEAMDTKVRGMMRVYTTEQARKAAEAAAEAQRQNEKLAAQELEAAKAAGSDAEKYINDANAIYNKMVADGKAAAAQIFIAAARSRYDDLKRSAIVKAETAQEIARPVKTAPAPAPVVLSTGQKVFTATEVKFEVVDKSKVPMEFLVVDMVALRRAIVSEKRRDIPGVVVTEEQATRIR